MSIQARYSVIALVVAVVVVVMTTMNTRSFVDVLLVPVHAQGYGSVAAPRPYTNPDSTTTYGIPRTDTYQGGYTDTYTPYSHSTDPYYTEPYDNIFRDTTPYAGPNPYARYPSHSTYDLEDGRLRELKQDMDYAYEQYLNARTYSEQVHWHNLYKGYRRDLEGYRRSIRHSPDEILLDLRR